MPQSLQVQCEARSMVNCERDALEPHEPHADFIFCVPFQVAGYNLLLRTLVVLSCGMDVDTGKPVEGGAGWPFAQVGHPAQMYLRSSRCCEM